MEEQEQAIKANVIGAKTGQSGTYAECAVR